jgi:molybdate transport system permease protein
VTPPAAPAVAARPLRARLFIPAAAACLGVTLVFLALPVAAIFVDTSPARLLDSLGRDASLDALRLSLETSMVALAVIVGVGTPTAYLLATRRFRGRALLVTVIELPLVLPPAVAGIGLLAALGPQGVLGPVLRDFGIDPLPLTRAAVVVALVFVASPYFLRQAQAAFSAVDPTLLDAARTLGAGEGRVFARVAVPLAAAGLGAGASLAWGRAIGEFGATLMFAGSFQGVTQTAPLAIYAEFGTDFPAALALSAVLVAVSAAILLSSKLLGGRLERRAGG